MMIITVKTGPRTRTAPTRRPRKRNRARDHAQSHARNARAKSQSQKSAKRGEILKSNRLKNFENFQHEKVSTLANFQYLKFFQHLLNSISFRYLEIFKILKLQKCLIPTFFITQKFNTYHFQPLAIKIKA